MRHFRALLVVFLLFAAGGVHAQAIKYMLTGQGNKFWHSYQNDTSGVVDSLLTRRDWQSIKDSSHFYGKATPTVQYAIYYYPVRLDGAGHIVGGTKVDSMGNEPSPADVLIGGVTATDGQLLIGTTSSGRFSAHTVTAGTGVGVTNGSGSISLSIGQSVATTATPTFASETLTATTNQVTLGASSHKDILSATAPAAASNTYTFPDAGGAANVALVTVGNGRMAWVTTSADTSTTGQTLLGTPLQFAVGITQTWQFEAVIYDSSSSSAGVKFGYSLPTGATVTSIGVGQTTGVTAFTSDIITAGATAGAAVGTVAGYSLYVVHGTITTDGTHTGNVILQFEKATSGTAIVKAGSYLMARRVS